MYVSTLLRIWHTTKLIILIILIISIGLPLFLGIISESDDGSSGEHIEGY